MLGSHFDDVLAMQWEPLTKFLWDYAGCQGGLYTTYVFIVQVDSTSESAIFTQDTGSYV